ncbi:hypothetical protein LI90_2483 [Carbonactinospora thermoautotrophica]|uniref:Uncharacterized protein n=1 Tax=Carbonactinospora thermoautotrophica TaxID=1469144 RepID=A0A132MVP8_9ACTN|nr:hypothetical protein LI90_2483 [Carbonactinospora thermoautotrophica]
MPRRSPQRQPAGSGPRGTSRTRWHCPGGPAPSQATASAPCRTSTTIGSGQTHAARQAAGSGARPTRLVLIWPGPLAGRTSDWHPPPGLLVSLNPAGGIHPARPRPYHVRVAE